MQESISDIQKRHEEEILAELHEEKMRRFPGEVLGEIQLIQSSLQSMDSSCDSIARDVARFKNEEPLAMHFAIKDLKEGVDAIGSLLWIVIVLLAILVFK